MTRKGRPVGKGQALTGKILYRVVGLTFAVPVSYLVRRSLRAAWLRSRGTEPPARPGQPGTNWKDAVIWATASAAGIAVGEIVAGRASVRAFHAVTGRYPPGMEPADAQR